MHRHWQRVKLASRRISTKEKPSLDYCGQRIESEWHGSRRVWSGLVPKSTAHYRINHLKAISPELTNGLSKTLSVLSRQ
jgi:hypothetical protein